jgi:glycosyltransferase involved in cell wall biosynthesis
MSEKPLVSVIIPVHNCERYLAEAIESVLSQTHQPLEIIVVDDGSSDRSAEVARRYAPPAWYYFQPNSGVGAALNCGIDQARSSFFAFLDADDLWTKDKLTLQMTAFDNDPELDIVFGHVKQFHSPELSGDQKRRIHCPAEAMPGYGAGTMLVTREAFLRVGPFETKWQVGEFVDWYSRAQDLGLRARTLSEVVYKRRLHTTNLGIRKRDAQTDYLRILKASLDRRRRMHSQGKITQSSNGSADKPKAE